MNNTDAFSVGSAYHQPTPALDDVMNQNYINTNLPPPHYHPAIGGHTSDGHTDMMGTLPGDMMVNQQSATEELMNGDEFVDGGPNSPPFWPPQTMDPDYERPMYYTQADDTQQAQMTGI